MFVFGVCVCASTDKKYMGNSGGGVEVAWKRYENFV